MILKRVIRKAYALVSIRNLISELYTNSKINYRRVLTKNDESSKVSPWIQPYSSCCHVIQYYYIIKTIQTITTWRFIFTEEAVEHLACVLTSIATYFHVIHFFIQYFFLVTLGNPVIPRGGRGQPTLTEYLRLTLQLSPEALL